MRQIFYPDEYYDSAYHIPYETLYKEGYRGVIYDIDNTLVPHGAAADERSLCLLRNLQEQGFSITFLSNNDRERVEMFNKDIHANMIWKAGKPGRKNYEKAMQLMHTDKNTTIFIGDQLFTDIWGANRAGIRSILVKPIHPKEEVQIVLKRLLEKPILYFYVKQHGCKTGEPYNKNSKA